MKRLLACAALAACIVAGGLSARASAAAKAPAKATAKSAAVTDEAVLRAIDKATEYITKTQKPDGSWTESKGFSSNAEVGRTELALLTLVYIGIHPNRDVVSKALDQVINRNLDYTYAVCARTMALAHLQNKLVGDKREYVRQAMLRDVQWLVQTQGPGGGWGYNGLAGVNRSATYQDLSNTQMAVLALREAALAGAEIPRSTWQRVQDLYFKSQLKDGSWNYGETDKRVGGASRAGYGSMTAAGLASVLITSDNLDLASGCPCRGSASGRQTGDMDRRIDSALGWLEKHFKASSNPEGGDTFGSRVHYWLYSVERVGSAAGYKYFGGHDWFKEGAAFLLGTQSADGAWAGEYGPLVTTCFSTLFLYKGRAPILFNKLEFKGEWNNHRRDIANLTQFVMRAKEQPFGWQIVSFRAPVEELHDAPILYITPEDAPAFSPEEKQKLRRFTDTGGTILFEASCGNPIARKFIEGLAKEVWPEWPVLPLPREHPVFQDPYRLKNAPELRGASDGIRTFLFYEPDDVSCAWQMKSYTLKQYLFDWGMNMVAYATDNAPLRARLAAQTPPPDKRFAAPVTAGPQKTVKVARLKHAGDWAVGANYQGFARLAEQVKSKAAVTLEAKEDGVAPGQLAGYDAVFVASTKPFEAAAEDAAALKSFAAGGGFVWLEAAAGSPDVDQSMRKLAGQAGWRMEPLPRTHALVTGKMPPASGYDLTKDLKFRSALRVIRAGRAEADIIGIFAGEKLVGIYSPLDVMFALNPYEAYKLRGYDSPDAMAVATNIVLWMTTRPAAKQ